MKRCAFGLISILWILCFSLAPANAQNESPLFIDLTSKKLPVDDRTSFAITLGDVDKDGDVDILVANSFFANYSLSSHGQPNQNQLLINDGTGIFTDETKQRIQGIMGRFSRDIALADLDGDADLDIYEANTGEQHRLFINNGKGVFEEETYRRLPVLTDATEEVEIYDFNGDSKLDILLVNSQPLSEMLPPPEMLSPALRLLLNDGLGFFLYQDQTKERLPPLNLTPKSAAIGDVDGDLDMDIVLACPGGQRTGLLINEGQGFFKDETSLRLPEDSQTDSRDVVLADIDSDGDLDIYLVNSGNTPGYHLQDRLYINNGTGFFTDETTARMPIPKEAEEYYRAFGTKALIEDFDLDGDLDIFVSHEFDSQNILFLNNGKGFFTEASSQLPQTDDYSLSCVAGDVDSDGDMDILVANRGQNVFLANTTNPLLKATLYFKPEDIQLQAAEGTFTLFVELPKSFSRAKINLSSVLLQGTISAKGTSTAINDFNKNGLPDWQLKFDRAFLINFLAGQAGTVTIKLTGQVVRDSQVYQFEGKKSLVLPEAKAEQLPVSDISRPD